MAALFYYPTVLEHCDAVGMKHRRQAVRNHNGRAASGNSLRGLLNPGLGL
jgi:hypothetical protein